MQVQRVNSFEELLPLGERWDALAGECPFRRWTWLSTWWKHYGPKQTDLQHGSRLNSRRELCVLLVCEDQNSCGSLSKDAATQANRLVAIAPCYIERSPVRGSVLRLLGDGEVCSDHLSLLVDHARQKEAVEALAQYLSNQFHDWDLLDFTGIEASDANLRNLLATLKKNHCLVQRRDGLSRWALQLPECWEQFLAMLSKSHRKQLRRLERGLLNTDRTTWHLVEQPDQFDEAWDALVDLHQRRRKSLGEPGCFASPQFADFHREVARCFLDEQRLRLSWLELDGKPVAAEYQLTGSSVTYAYQGGIDPEQIEQSPGQMSLIRSLQHAIDSGQREFDFLRGDEPYKAHWRAKPQATFDVQVVPARTGARWRYGSWSQARRAGRWARGLVRRD